MDADLVFADYELGSHIVRTLREVGANLKHEGMKREALPISLQPSVPAPARIPPEALDEQLDRDASRVPEVDPFPSRHFAIYEALQLVIEGLYAALVKVESNDADKALAELAVAGEREQVSRIL